MAIYGAIYTVTMKQIKQRNVLKMTKDIGCVAKFVGSR